RGSEAGTELTRYVSWLGSTRYVGTIASRTTPSYGGAGSRSLDLRYEDGIYLLAATFMPSSSSSTAGIPYAYQMSRRSSGGLLDIRTINLPLPQLVYEGISVVRFPDSFTYPDLVFYN